ncbi:hypothetical protein QUF72_06775 [Desulfobacterales bacterium HSG2]|nr:hypothetical protein [Desulfobacterales bacterium HSG2]
MIVRNQQGKIFQLYDKNIGKGGEARILAVNRDSEKVAKIYHKPTSQHEAKIAAMIANPPTQPKTHPAVAWPVDLLYQRKRFVGFLMPKVQGSNAIFKCYLPNNRNKASPAFTWRHLHRTALNLSVAVDSIHARGQVIGDINESNILVSDNALVTFVDTDSFQIKDSFGRNYRCAVGRPEYTPPELQGLDFKTVERRAEHDYFGLGVLIFRLLMKGIHPFAGVLSSRKSVGRVDIYCIKHGLFPYPQNRAVKPPPKAPRFDILHPHIQASFIRCFFSGHQTPFQRPSAKEWRWILERMEKALVVCHQNPNHVYSNHQAQCPWCPVGSPRQKSTAPKVAVPHSNREGFEQKRRTAFLKSLRQQRSPDVAVLLSLFLPGSGQIYTGQVGIGLLYLALTYCLCSTDSLHFLIKLWAIIFYGWVTIDAYLYAKNLNTQQTRIPPKSSTQGKSPAKAVIYSLVPGMGQIYNGQVAIGILCFIATLLSYLTIIGGILFHIGMMHDAYSYAVKTQPVQKICPYCGYQGPPKKVAKGSFPFALFLSLLYIIPGVIYGILKRGHRYICPNCKGGWNMPGFKW